METTVKDRLISFIKYKGLNKNSFEKICGFGTSYVNNIRVSIQPDKVQRIAHNFPDLNTGWLLTGEGDMLKADQEPQSSVMIDRRVLDTIISQQETIRSQQLLIEKLVDKKIQVDAQKDGHVECAGALGA